MVGQAAHCRTWLVSNRCLAALGRAAHALRAAPRQFHRVERTQPRVQQLIGPAIRTFVGRPKRGCTAPVPPPPGLSDEAHGQPDPLVHRTRPVRHRSRVCRARHRRRGLLSLRAPHRQPSRDRRYRGPLRRQRTTTMHPLPAAKRRHCPCPKRPPPHTSSKTPNSTSRFPPTIWTHSRPCATPRSTRTRSSSAGNNRPLGY
jgi:hypothetical protein